MGLSDKEREVLEELERQLNGGKPKPKAATTQVSAVGYRRLLVVGSLLVVGGLGIMISATSIHAVWLGVVAFLVMLAGLYLVSQNWSSRAIKAAKKPAKSTKPKGKFFENLWIDRND